MGEPYSASLMAATASAPSAATAPQASAGAIRRWRNATIAATTAASGTRFGLIAIATAAAAPAPSAAANDAPHAHASASVQNAVTGTSVIGITSHISSGGLDAISAAATTPAHGPS